MVAHAHAGFDPNGHIQPVSTWNSQGWHRAPSGPCGSGSKTPNAVRASFRP